MTYSPTAIEISKRGSFMNRSFVAGLIFLTLAFPILALFAPSVAAEESTKPKEPSSSAKDRLTPSEIAKEFLDPIGALRRVYFQLDVLPDVGPDNNTAWESTIQAIWPFDIGDDWKFVTYSIIPLLSEPGVAPGDDRKNGLGDSNFFGYFARATKGGVIWGVGPALQAPTHTDDALGTDKWAAGPALIVGVEAGNWSIFGLFDHVWSFAGPGDEEINRSTVQYDVVYLFPKEWFLATYWVVEADWEATSADRWTVPIGGGLGKQFKLGGQYFQAFGEVGYNVVRPDGATGWRAIAVLGLAF